ncbi:MAG: hypothetical protein Q4G03_04290 [Planctomycetia bacterium]|nr:hypothetical protein [Planctomycetia bacterium]
MSLFLLCLTARICFGQTELDKQMTGAWDATWAHFYSPQTRLFYDFLQSLEPGKTLDHLPTQNEVETLSPNVYGYGTAMEDCAISGGVALEALILRYGNEKRLGASASELATIKSQAQDVFSGLELLTTVSGSPGFVARGVSPKAPGKCYINSSRDQVTHLSGAVWEYSVSELSDVQSRARAADILYAIADRMTRNVIPENDYDFLCADGSRCRNGICRMKEVEDHEAARLTMIYAVAYDVAKRQGDQAREKEYWARWRELADATVAQSAHIRENTALSGRMPAYALLQMQESLAILYRLEPDVELRESLSQTLDYVADLAKARQHRALNALKTRDLTVLAPPWRVVGGLTGEYRACWYAPRECGELALTIALNPQKDSLDAESLEVLKTALTTPDYWKLTSCGILHLLQAYELARSLGKL